MRQQTGVKAFVKRRLESLFESRGYSLIPANVLRAYDAGSDPVPSPPLSAEALRYLRNDNPRLQELRSRYAALSVDAVAHSLWDADYISAEVLLDAFRAHSAYVWTHQELSRPTQLKYFLYSQYAKSKAPHVLKRLHEDGAFGAMCYDFEVAGRVSRDRLDSAIEIDFLDRHLKILTRPQLRVLDVGAGYGRLAHRICEAGAQVADYVCVDAIPESTFLAEYYAGFRALPERVRVVPLDEVVKNGAPTLGRFDLAINVHSFSECSYAAIQWWIARLQELAVPYLFIVPNTDTRFISTETDRTRKDFLPLLEQAGYRIVAHEPLFDDPDLLRLLSITDQLFLFRRG
jgi:putative sugar O-methyltransferase